MNTLREAAQQALEAMESAEVDPHSSDVVYKAITALKAALAEYDKDRVKVEEMKANWALQRKLAQETEERDKRQREYEEQRLAALAESMQEPDLSRCPQCGGPADNGHDRSIPPSPYFCTKCMAEPVQEPAALPLEEALSKAYYYTEDGRWRGPVRDWDRWHAVAKVAVALTRRAALAEPEQDGCDHCNHPMYAAVKCKVCGRVTEPVQGPYAWMSVGGSIWRHKTTEDDVPLYTAPRKPLTEWQINDLMSDIDPEDRDSWSFRQGVYAAEKHHGVRR